MWDNEKFAPFVPINWKIIEFLFNSSFDWTFFFCSSKNDNVSNIIKEISVMWNNTINWGLSKYIFCLFKSQKIKSGKPIRPKIFLTTRLTQGIGLWLVKIEIIYSKKSVDNYVSGNIQILTENQQIFVFSININQR